MPLINIEPMLKMCKTFLYCVYKGTEKKKQNNQQKPIMTGKIVETGNKNVFICYIIRNLLLLAIASTYTLYIVHDDPDSSLITSEKVKEGIPTMLTFLH